MTATTARAVCATAPLRLAAHGGEGHRLDRHAGCGLAHGPERTFTIDDGYGTSKTFEIDKDNNVTRARHGRTSPPGGPRRQVAAIIANAINGAGLLVHGADADAGIIPLVHQRFSAKGNQTITSNINDQGWTTVGMSGGAGGDCDAGDRCTDDDDCASNNCSNSSPHVCQ